MIRSVIILFCFSLLSCSQKAFLKRDIGRIENQLQEHAGFALYDPAAEKFLFQHQADKYFTPASNTKIFTLYTSMHLLGDSVASVKYEVSNDTLYIQGVGDPSFLYHNVFDTQVTYQFLSSHRGVIAFNANNFFTDRFGAGWAWDDYPYYYSPERSSLPVYGNLIRLGKDSLNRFTVQPRMFADSVRTQTGDKNNNGPMRNFFNNQVAFYDYKKGPIGWEVPFHYSDSLLVKMLSDTLHRAVALTNKRPGAGSKLLRSTPVDSVYRVMMQDSDNFIAEQLLLQCSAIVSDSLRPEIAIAYAKKNLLSDLPDEPQWVDGSGLSRFNLFTPRSVVKLWEKIGKEIPPDRLFKIVAIGGKPGTLRNWYKAEPPYVFGKTGSLSNNHCLSGFVRTRKGRVLIFSFMHNNFVQPSRTVRVEMENVIRRIHEKY